jgi:hypothetical protein
MTPSFKKGFKIVSEMKSSFLIEGFWRFMKISRCTEGHVASEIKGGGDWEKASVRLPLLKEGRQKRTFFLPCVWVKMTGTSTWDVSRPQSPTFSIYSDTIK